VWPLSQVHNLSMKIIWFLKAKKTSDFASNRSSETFDFFVASWKITQIVSLRDLLQLEQDPSTVYFIWNKKKLNKLWKSITFCKGWHKRKTVYRVIKIGTDWKNENGSGFDFQALYWGKVVKKAILSWALSELISKCLNTLSWR